jgi:hypothetical protein
MTLSNKPLHETAVGTSDGGIFIKMKGAKA